MKKIVVGLLSLGSLLCMPGAALAERADALQPIKVLAESGEAGDIDQSGVAEGNVVLTRGTLIIKSGKMKLDQDKDGYYTVVLTAAPGALVTFRQKRDGNDLWAEGEAERIVYTDRDDIMKLTGRAKVTSLDGAKIDNQIKGQFVSYDSRKGAIKAINASEGPAKSNGQLIEMIFDRSKRTAPAATPAPAAKP
ncbi:MAG: lipopolysaccharide transport periplasmic protein LptA [Massilia sp.]